MLRKLLIHYKLDNMFLKNNWDSRENTELTIICIIWFLFVLIDQSEKKT